MGPRGDIESHEKWVNTFNECPLTSINVFDPTQFFLLMKNLKCF